MRYLFIGVVLMGLGFSCPRPVHAEIGFELYSWQQGMRWEYAIFEGTMTVRTTSALRSAKHRLKDVNFLKGRIAALPAGERLYWREDKKRGLRLPPKEIIRDIDQYAQLSNIVLLLPGQNTDGKTLEQLQAETQQLLE